MRISVKYVMTIAWNKMRELVARNNDIDTANRKGFFKAFLKQAWAQAKEEMNTITAESIETVELDGSEKQISWAKEIRANYINSLVNTFNKNAKKMSVSVDQLNTMTAQFTAMVNKISTAKWWIENRMNNISNALANA